MRAAYNRAEYIAERRTMMIHWADHLDSLAGKNVVTFYRHSGNNVVDHDLYLQQSASSRPPHSTSRITARESHEAARFYTTRVIFYRFQLASPCRL